MTADVTPFPIAVPERDLDDLRARLARTRWPERETVGDTSQGVPLAYVRELCETWRDDYDWRPAEATLNGYGSSRVEVDGLGIHLLHVRSPHPGAMPLLLTHGWPGSVLEFRKVIDRLVDPVAHGGDAADAFHVVCPSLPGYGWSDKPTRTGWGVPRIAAAWAQLMARLGYDRYGAQGGDWGAIVTMALAGLDADHLAGIHLNMPLVGPDSIAAAGEPNDEERAAIARLGRHQADGSGYSQLQGTRPQTLGYGLADSPAGQCAWIVEKFAAWMDCGGEPESVLTRQELLDNVMMYWLPCAATSSARLYWESSGRIDMSPIEVPAGLSNFPEEIVPVPRRWAEHRFRDLRLWRRHDRGGHFAALERPDVLVDDVRDLFRALR